MKLIIAQIFYIRPMAYCNVNVKITDKNIWHLIIDKQHELQKTSNGELKNKTPIPDTIIKCLEELVSIKEKKKK